MPLTDEGLELPLLEDLLAEIEDDQRARLGSGLRSGPTSVLGQLNASWASPLREVLELLGAVYDSLDPDLATGAALDRLCALTGTERQDATPSLVSVDVTLADGTTVAPGELVLAVDGSEEDTFANLVELANDSGAQDVVSGLFASLATGPVPAPAGRLTVVSQPIAGVVSATNPEDAAPGREREGDPDLRVRRRDELFRPGSSTPDAIVVDVLDEVVDDEGERQLLSVRVFENVTMQTNADGLPPKSLEVLAWDGTPDGSLVSDDRIAQAVWRAKPGGIQTHGTSSGTATDVAGGEHAIAFSRPTVLEVHVRLVLEVSSDWAGSDDEAALAASVAAYGARQGIGRDVVASRLGAFVLRPSDDPDGPDVGPESRVVDLVEVRIDTADPPVNVGNLDVGPRELAELDSSRVSFEYA